MKNAILLLLLTFFLFGFSQAQNNFPLPADNPFWIESHSTKWTCSTQGTNGNCYGYICKCDMPVYYKSDTIINGTTYNRLYTRGVCRGTYPHQPDPGCPYSFDYLEAEKLHAIIRHDTTNRRVYIYNNGIDTLLYDFNAIQLGQPYPKTFNNVLPDTLVVISEDSISIRNDYAKKWGLGIKQNGQMTYTNFVYIIEGIGSTFGISAPLAPPFENGDWLLCYSENDVVHYSFNGANCDKDLYIPDRIKEDFSLSIHPNPAAKFINFSVNYKGSLKARVRIFDVNGKEVHSCEIHKQETTIDICALRKGLYFIQYSNQYLSKGKPFIKE